MALSLFIEISLVILSAVLVIGLIRLLKQPIIIGYIITGIIYALYISKYVVSTGVINMFSELGIAILLFMVGLNLNPKTIKEVGKVSLVTGIGQVIFTAGIGYYICKLLGFSSVTAIYLSVGLAFSSTIIIMKLLSDKQDLDKLYGRISIGFLIVQDIIAIIALMVISSLSSGQHISNFLVSVFIKGIITTSLLFLIGIYIIPRITKSIARSQEFLLLFALGWAFTISTIYELIGFSVEIGALIAGITLALSPYRFEISSKLKPIRDFFIFMFFIWLGTQMTFGTISTNIHTIIILSLFVLIGNPLIVMTLMGLMNFRKQTGFQAGLTVAQISEFSLILIALGVKVGHLSKDILSLMTIVGIITIAGSTYMIIYSEKLYSKISKFLSIFERKSAKESISLERKYETILFGANRTGHDIIESLKDKKKSLLVVDYNPETISRLTKKGYDCMYGDISDIDLINEIDLCSAKILVSTIPDLDSNLLFLKRARLCNKDVITLIVANNVDDALELYNEGASLVITPQFLSGHFLAEKIKSYGFKPNEFKKDKQKHLEKLTKIKEEKLTSF